MGKIINIESKDTGDFYIKYLTIIRPLLSTSLRDGELRVLAQLLSHTDRYRDLKPKERSVLIFDWDNVNIILDDLNISRNTFNNILTALRKKNYLINNEVKESLMIPSDKDYKITYNFKEVK